MRKSMQDTYISQTNELEKKAHDYFNQRLEARSTMSKRFKRPEKGFPGLLNRPLGPLPQDMLVLDGDSEQFPGSGSYRWAGLGLLVLAVGCLIALAVWLPWLAVSPATLLIMLFRAFMPTWIAVVLTGVVGAIFMHYTGKVQ